MLAKERVKIKKHFQEILEYRAVLSNHLKRKVTFEQAAADWLEKGYFEKSIRRF